MILVPKTRSDVQAMIDSMSAQDRSYLSAAWLAELAASPENNPWVFGFSATLTQGGPVIGTGGFKGAPRDGTVEIAYAVNEDLRGKGHGTEIARGLVAFAFSHPEIRTVIAHTLPDGAASQRILKKCGFSKTGEHVDPEDGLVWRFERSRTNA